MKLSSRYAVLTLFAVLNPWLPLNALDIESEPAQSRQVSTTYMLEGLVEAELQTTISARTAGVAKQVFYDVNDLVNKGEVVVLIDDKQQQADLRQAEAARNEARARLQEAQSEYDRIKEVYQQKVVSKADFDKANAALQSARARFESSNAAFSKAQEQLEYTRVRAPFSGIMTARLVEQGEAVSVGMQLVTGVSLERMRVITQVPQSIIDEVRSHRRAIVVTDNSEIVSGDMTFFPFADPASHSFALRVRLPQSESELFPGMHVKVAMEVGREQKTVIPFNSVAFRGEVTGIYVLQDGKLRFRHVRLGRRLDNNEVVVVAGVVPGELVVTDPVAAAIQIKADAEL